MRHHHCISLSCFALYLVIIASVSTMPATTLAQSDLRSKGERLNRLLHDSLNAGNFNSAIKHGLNLVELLPDDGLPAYNLACAYSRSGDKDLAVTWLSKAGELGFYYLSTAKRDTDLDAVRRHKGFDDAISTIRRNNDKELDALKPQIDRASLVTYLPPAYDSSKAAPLVVVLHGSGGRGKEWADVWRKVAGESGSILVAPQAHTPMGSGYQWGVIEQAHYEILSAINRTKAAYKIDDQQVVLAGFSQGASMTISVALEYPGLVKGIVAIAGFHEKKLNPVDHNIDENFPRFFIMNGSLDREAQNNRDLAHALKEAGATVELRIYKGVGHWLPPNQDQEFADGLRFILGG